VGKGWWEKTSSINVIMRKTYSPLPPPPRPHMSTETAHATPYHLASEMCQEVPKRNPHSDNCTCQFGALVRRNGSYGVPLEYSGDRVAKALVREKIDHELYLVSFSAYNGPERG